MKKFSTFLFIAIVGFFGACKDEADQEADEAVNSIDTADVDRVDTVLTDETISFFNRSGFSEFAKSRSPEFDWSKFRMTNTWQDDSLLVTDFKPSPDFYESYRRFLKYSPDSTMFIDLDSYNLSVSKDKNGNLVAIEHGPDTEVSLVNAQTKKKTRLVFLGPGNSIEDASWIDDENLIMMGFQQEGNTEKKVPVIWRYHLPTTTFYIYEMPDENVAAKLMGQWRKERLKGLKLR